VKARLVNPDKNAGFGVSLASVVFVPSGANASFNSDGGVRGEPRVSVSWQSEGWEIIGNAGFQFRPATDVRNLAAGPSTRWGLGGVAPVGSTGLDLFANVFGSYTVVQPEDGSLGGGDNSEAHPVEALAGVRYDLPGGVRLQAGGGTGLTAGVGAPDFRVFTSVHWAFRKRDTDGDGFWDSNDNCPERAEDEDDFEDGDGCPDPDNDDDGIEDSDDGCPEEAEDADDFEDADGCPDPDNDGDGIADEEDRCPTTAGIAELEGCPENDRDGDGIEDRDDECPMDPEDEDGFEDDNGCPDPDNDGDGIVDAKDECPDEPEVENGLADADGCPDADTDGDGIRDAEDDCPEEAEVVNGIDDEDGCPDEKESKVKVVKQKIEISEKVHFATNKAEIQQRSFELLREVAGLLEKYPQITKIRVAGHTDSHGSADYNKKLSKERAEAVRLFLIEQGIGRERLEAKGFGEEEPIALNRTEEGRAANRRVEFVIVEVDGQPVEPDSKIELETEKKVEE
jgi:outer membrane protein OmpA-like peptidoglycan-associated protein